LVVIIIIAVNYFSSSSVRGNIPTAKVQRGEIIITQTESGELRASKNVTITAPARSRGGLLIVDMIPEGTIVEEGDTLIKFDTQDAVDLIQAREDHVIGHIEELEKLDAQQASRMEDMNANLQTIKNNYELAILSLENMKYESENKRQEAQLQYDNAKLNYDDQLTGIENQKIIDRVNRQSVLVNIKRGERDLEESKQLLEGLTILAPSPGRVVYKENWMMGTYVKVKIGDNAHPSQPLIELPDLNEFQVTLKVNEIDVDKYQIGQEVKITLDAYSEESFVGIVTGISSLVEGFVSNLRLFSVIITLQEKDNPMLRPGMTTRAEICLKKIPDALYIPVESVFEKDGNPIVFPRSSGYKEKEVVIGERSMNYIIINDNLEEGDDVALIDPTEEADRLGSARETELRLQRRKEIIEKFVGAPSQPANINDDDQVRQKKSERGSESFNPNEGNQEVMGAYLESLLQDPEIKKEYDKMIENDPEFEKDSQKKAQFFMDILQKIREKEQEK
ncbi:efflux RND transporter periplasmic adaptor subunit, partial [candidate division KSB1 bacterium]